MKFQTTNVWKNKKRLFIQRTACCRESNEGEKLKSTLEAWQTHYADLVPAMHDCILGRVFMDEAYNGTQTGRSGLQELAALCKTGYLYRVIVKSIFQLSQDRLNTLATEGGYLECHM